MSQGKVRKPYVYWGKSTNTFAREEGSDEEGIMTRNPSFMGLEPRFCIAKTPGCIQFYQRINDTTNTMKGTKLRDLQKPCLVVTGN
jgi:hypothetical protein